MIFSSIIIISFLSLSRNISSSSFSSSADTGPEDEELTVLGNQLQLVGRLLSTPSTGAPTLLYKCLFAQAVGCALCVRVVGCSVYYGV